MEMNIFLCIFVAHHVYGNALRATQSTVKLMREPEDAIDGNTMTYSLTENQTEQYWSVRLDKSYNVSSVFIRIRGANTNKMFHLYINNEKGTSNETLYNEFSFNNTIINEEYIRSRAKLQGNTLTLRRNGEIRLFEFRPLVINPRSVLDIISGKAVDCFQNASPDIVGTTLSYDEKTKCSVCESQIFPKMCNEIKDEIWVSVLIVCGGSFGGVLILALALFIKLKLRKKNEKSYDVIVLEEIHQSVPDLLNFELEEEEVEYCNLTSYRVSIDTFIQDVARKKTYNTFLEEFQSLPNGLTDAYTEALKWTNMSKNRYRKVYPYDYSRVILDPAEGSGKTDYINASYINGFDREKAYIAAQGPFSSDTLKDFWAMIWQNNCTRVVMLTNIYEGEKISCLRYWPHTEDFIGPFHIKVDRQDSYRDYTIRQLVVTKETENLDRQMRISHFHFTAWHETRVPECEDSILCFRNLVKCGLSTSDGPILVHCSAGIGRTGTFIALDYLLEESLAKKDLDLINCVSALRQQRGFAVQTCEEYIFLHEALVKYFVKHRLMTVAQHLPLQSVSLNP
ncbi:receptor-type tyrosine-protein phosphatase C-like [Saccostrea echinata]|uniref:receptor-type tyrosine-protein phosphatase C-like n=1 Tax=Saccostrea echinata TaxID=191078 RepID=UPI002A831552|nr:receptor-type tyrosine-protein phosphatase C-like [Saccostrea echinata]